MCVELDLELMCQRSKKDSRPSNFHEFWIEEVHYIKDLQK
jgi:hypothetical protein